MIACHAGGMIPEEEAPAVEDDALFEDDPADFMEPGEPGSYVLSTRRPGAVSGPS